MQYNQNPQGNKNPQQQQYPQMNQYQNPNFIPNQQYPPQNYYPNQQMQQTQQNYNYPPNPNMNQNMYQYPPQQNAYNFQQQPQQQFNNNQNQQQNQQQFKNDQTKYPQFQDQQYQFNQDFNNMNIQQPQQAKFGGGEIDQEQKKREKLNSLKNIFGADPNQLQEDQNTLKLPQKFEIISELTQSSFVNQKGKQIYNDDFPNFNLQESTVTVENVNQVQINQLQNQYNIQESMVMDNQNTMYNQVNSQQIQQSKPQQLQNHQTHYVQRPPNQQQQPQQQQYQQQQQQQYPQNYQYQQQQYQFQPQQQQRVDNQQKYPFYQQQQKYNQKKDIPIDIIAQNLLMPFDYNPQQQNINPVTMSIYNIKSEKEDVEYVCTRDILDFDKFEKAYKGLKQTNKQFTDTEFKANINSLIEHNNSPYKEKWGKYVWLRPIQFFQNEYKIFQRPLHEFEKHISDFKDKNLGNNLVQSKTDLGISPEDIKQGQLGDCYFLASISALAEWPKRVKDLFITRKVNPYGIYCVKINYFGEWKAVHIDDQFPCYNQQRGPCFTTGNGNELWVLILEKVWAKLFGNYEKIESGLAREALRAMTGAPTKTIWTDDDQEDLWEQIKAADENNFIMTAGAQEKEQLSQSTQDRLGLVAQHAYSLISAHEIDARKFNLPNDSANNKGIARLIKLRNPWGSKEWTGKWSDQSKVWTPQLKKELSHEDLNSNDGLFIMEFADFIRYFSDIQICYYIDSYLYTSYRAVSEYRRAKYFMIKITAKGSYFITISQESKRNFTPEQQYQYSNCRLLVTKVVGKNKTQFVNAVQKADWEVWAECQNLTPGDYIVQAKLEWFDKKQREFVISSYGPAKVEFMEIASNFMPNLIESALISMPKPQMKDYGQHGYPGIKKCFDGKPALGWGFFYVINGSNKNIQMTVTFTKHEGLKPRKPYRDFKYELIMLPNEDKIVPFKVSKTGYTMSYQESLKFL